MVISLEYSPPWRDMVNLPMIGLSDSQKIPAARVRVRHRFENNVAVSNEY